MKIINTEKKLIKSWATDIEPEALEQAKNLANLPFIQKWIAIMPDTHKGFGMPIGGVMATKGVIVPNAVGKDIGCGMCAVKTSLTSIDTELLKKIMGEIRQAIPVGFNHQEKQQNENLMPIIKKDLPIYETEYPVVFKEYHSALRQLGTLGGGNHFIEIQKGSDGHIWIMIHSGSRNLGSKVADYYNDLAIELNAKWYSEVPKIEELAFLPVESKEGRS
jgi:tRNA-splicing ligase RtcB